MDDSGLVKFWAVQNFKYKPANDLVVRFSKLNEDNWSSGSALPILAPPIGHPALPKES